MIWRVDLKSQGGISDLKAAMKLWWLKESVLREKERKNKVKKISKYSNKQSNKKGNFFHQFCKRSIRRDRRQKGTLNCLLFTKKKANKVKKVNCCVPSSYIYPNGRKRKRKHERRTETKFALSIQETNLSPFIPKKEENNTQNHVGLPSLSTHRKKTRSKGGERERNLLPRSKIWP